MAENKNETVNTANESKKSETRFKKDSLVSSVRYADKKDIINALLEDDKEYTFTEVDVLINKFMKGKVE